jgi:transposase InsO family protein
MKAREKCYILAPISFLAHDFGPNEPAAFCEQFHEPHAGINQTQALARKHYYWPGLSTDIAAMINNCDKCQLLGPSQAAEPLQRQPKLVEPMQSVSIYLYEVRGRHFLVMCDRFSYFCWAAQLNTLKSSTVIKIIDTWFHGVGYPQYIYSDSGPQFNAAEFKNYCEKHFITPLVSSACFPQSNGLAESAVKAAKYLLLKSENYTDFENKLYDLQNIPSSGDTFFKRRFCTHLPTLNPFFNPIMHEEGRKKFNIGDRVRIQNAISKRWDDTGSISKIRDSGRSCNVDRDRGRDTVLCNNIFLKLLAPPFALLREHAVEETRISSSSLPRLHAMPLPAMPAVAVPAVREPNREIS